MDDLEELGPTRLRMRMFAATIFLWLLAAMAGSAQVAAAPPDADRSPGASAVVSVESSPEPVVRPGPRPPAHRFLDLKNSLALASVAASLAGDGWSTQRALALPGAHEVNPVARPFVSSRAGEIAYSSAGFALVTGGMYLAHRTSHHRWERIGPYALAGWEGFLTAWNLRLISRAGH